jgi:hypothetical protein
MKEIKILVDTDEKADHAWSWEDSDFAGCEKKKLRHGDYSLDCFYDKEFLYLEKKKSAGELYMNLLSKDWQRFKKRLEEIKDFPHKFILCEMNFNDIFYRKPRNVDLPPEALVSKIYDIEIKYGVNFIFAGNKASAVALTLLKKMYREWKRFVTSKPKKQ